MESTIVNLNAAAADFDGTNDRALGEPAPVEVAGDLRNINKEESERTNETIGRAILGTYLNFTIFNNLIESSYTFKLMCRFLALTCPRVILFHFHPYLRDVSEFCLCTELSVVSMVQ